ncbi:hypothetical protein SM124_01345 [Bacillus sp. 31A1R]|uniref:Uncharacterized protein n=1 Tax=Robertmurraya mangrovi TaxID=3098077 RepID=A0ABU5ITD8_9BACI|nr:hypothetical protein [Bacillus sp. 31A1R]
MKEGEELGYIAPVNHYQYSQYAERDLRKPHDPFHFVPINKIKPLKNQEFQPFTKEEAVRKPHNKSKSLQKNRRFDIEKAYSEITGKGKYFSESV